MVHVWALLLSQIISLRCLWNFKFEVVYSVRRYYGLSGIQHCGRCHCCDVIMKHTMTSKTHWFGINHTWCDVIHTIYNWHETREQSVWHGSYGQITGKKWLNLVCVPFDNRTYTLYAIRDIKLSGGNAWAFCQRTSKGDWAWPRDSVIKWLAMK